ncbi:Flagellar motor rotation protein MotB [Collimonas arenae]|uniref:Flagellar motor rotation protein MotB n=1 Tax=Collimonas arenae TaxID=279058 RepID=A0A0A1FAA9_9BURK|nr:OmpA family protein [Collimonas arenae]AIY41476.1 Flagellar motor rotation protein MotB [Collimonas arenae]
MTDLSFGYPYRAIVAFAAGLALILVLGVFNLAPELKWILVVLILLVAVGMIALWSIRIARARERSAAMLGALGAVTADLPHSLRTQMPLLLVMGDGLPQLFLNGLDKRMAHVGDGAIWVRVDRAQDLSPLSLILRQWRDGRAPDGIVLALAPALYGDDHAVTHALRLIRQACSDTTRMLGTRIPGYLAVYQRLTSDQRDHDDAEPLWYGLSSGKPIKDTSAFESIIKAAEGQAQRAHGQSGPAWRAASLPDLMRWTRNVAMVALQDRNQPAAPWPLCGVAWVDCGPSTNPHSPWHRHLQERTHLTPPRFAASNSRWPLPQPLIEAMPQRAWISPRLRALAHLLFLIAAALALAGWAAARNNHALLAQASDNIARFVEVPAANDAARRDALSALTADRDRLERYQRTGVPLHLGFGMYRGAAVLPALNAAIASYQPPAKEPTIVTLDSMSLFASGQAQLKPGSTRSMVGALEMIKAHPNNRILVAGHTDNVGNPASNQQLSIARASAVRDWLVEAAELTPSRFAIQGYGDSKPIADNQTETGRARNRRVEITLVPDSPGT